LPAVESLLAHRLSKSFVPFQHRCVPQLQSLTFARNLQSNDQSRNSGFQNRTLFQAKWVKFVCGVTVSKKFREKTFSNKGTGFHINSSAFLFQIGFAGQRTLIARQSLPRNLLKKKIRKYGLNQNFGRAFSERTKKQKSQT
jgi:hypothetical protein